MYFFSGDATCLKVIPAWLVISVKLIFDGWRLADCDGNKGKSARIARKGYGLKAKLKLPL